MDRLTATPDMMRRAMSDTPLIVTGYRETREQYKYDLYLRCRIQNDILKVALFWTANMHKGGNLPIYEVYFSRAEKRFITYDCTYKKWLDSKLDRLEWPPVQIGLLHESIHQPANPHHHTGLPGNKKRPLFRTARLST